LEEETPSQIEHKRNNLLPYLSSHAGWYGALGIQMVLFPYLAAVVLDLPARYVGFAQLALMGPGLLFMLPGGAVADRVDERKHLIRLHVLSALPPLAMSVFLYLDHFNYQILLAYALTAGSLTAFATPARDSLLNHVVTRPELPKAVAAATMTQFAAQMVGMAIASTAGQLGPAPFVFLHGIAMIVGGFLIAKVSTPTVKPSRLGTKVTLGSQWHDILDALSEIAHSRAMLPVLLCNFAVGVCFVGSFLVVIPIIVRDVYLGGAAQLSLLNIGFWLGSIFSAMTIMRRGGVERRGKVILACITMGTVLLSTMVFQPPFWVLFFVMVLWGCGGGAVMTLGRTVVQEAAPPTHRARLMATYQLGFMGGGPIGAVTIGFLMDVFGSRYAVLFPAGAMALFLVLVVWRTSLWTLEARHSSQP
jgi:MFS family permease